MLEDCFKAAQWPPRVLRVNSSLLPLHLVALFTSSNLLASDLPFNTQLQSYYMVLQSTRIMPIVEFPPRRQFPPPAIFTFASANQNAECGVEESSILTNHHFNLNTGIYRPKSEQLHLLVRLPYTHSSHLQNGRKVHKWCSSAPLILCSVS